MSLRPLLLALLATLCGIIGAVYVRAGRPTPALGWFGIAALLVWPLFGFDAQSRAPATSLIEILRERRLERAIGVIYCPETERASHYFYARLSGQFDAVIHFDETRAVEPLERTGKWDTGEVPETFPSGI